MSKLTLKEKLKVFAEKNMKIEQLLKWLTPFELDFRLKIFSNRNKHDYAVLFRGISETIGLDAKDIQVLINNILAGRKSKVKATVTNAKYEKETYICVFVDIPK